MRFYKDRVILNVLGGSLANAGEIHETGDGHVLVALLASDYPDADTAVNDMKEYCDLVDGDLSVALGDGDPGQWKKVADIAREVRAIHFSQIFTAVSYTRACALKSDAVINCLVHPSGVPGKVIISTGPLSSKASAPAIVDIDTAAALIKDMGGDSLKLFPLNRLSSWEEYQEIAKGCVRNGLILEPAGGIGLHNIREILTIALSAGAVKLMPHIYSSIIDKESGNTRVEDVKKLLAIVKKLV